MSGENLVYTVTGGGMPDLTTIKATSAGHYPKVGVRHETGRMLVEAVVVEGGVTPNPTPVVWTHGTKTVTTAGTPVALSSTPTAFLAVIITPLRTNTGYAYLGSVITASTQHVIAPWMLSAPPGECIDLSVLYLDTSVNGEGVAWEAVN